MESKESVDRFSEDLVRAGFVVLAYDLRGFGNSEGVMHFGDPDYEIKDLGISISYIRSLEYVNSTAIGLTGVGYGGALTIMAAGILKDHINATFAMNSYNNLTDTFRYINYNSIQANVMRILSEYLGYIPHLFLGNEITEEQFYNIKGFLDLISDIPSMAKINEIIILENNTLNFNHTILNNNSPIKNNYASQIQDNSLFLAVGEEDKIYPYNFSRDLNNTLFTKYGINTYYHLFPNTGHSLETFQLDSALVNFFNLKLRNINPPGNDLYKNPYIVELDTFLTFKEVPRDISDDENIFLAIFNVFELIPLAFLIPYIISMVLLYFFIFTLFSLKKDLKFLTLKKKKTSKKQYREMHKSKKMIVRRIEKRRVLDVPDEEIMDEIDKSQFLYNKNVGVFVLIITLLNLILIPTLGMTYLNLNVFLVWLSILIVNIIFSIVFFSKFEAWEWKEDDNSENEISGIQLKEQKRSHKSDKPHERFERFIEILKGNPFYQIIFYLGVLFLVVLAISFLISPLHLNIVGFGLSQIFSTLILAGTIITILAILFIRFDKKYFNQDNTLDDYGFGKKQILKGFSFGVLIVQIPLVILIFASFILIMPQPFLSKSYAFIYMGIPFIFLYFFGFEIIFRVLIQNKIRGNYKGEFIIGSLFYAQFIGIFSYLIFMNSYTSTLVFSGIPISYSGLFGLIFIIFSIIGTLNYMITRTPVASSISNTLILFFILAVII
jgi:pimeloyl-ACP methyl ester carboxylesterase